MSIIILSYNPVISAEYQTARLTNKYFIETEYVTTQGIRETIIIHPRMQNR